MIRTIRPRRSATALGAPLTRAQPLLSGTILIRDGSGGNSILGNLPSRHRNQWFAWDSAQVGSAHQVSAKNASNAVDIPLPCIALSPLPQLSLTSRVPLNRILITYPAQRHAFLTVAYILHS